MKKTILNIFIFLISMSFAFAHYDLGGYPEFFLEDDAPNVIIVVGDKAPASHVLAQTKIALSLGTEFGQPLSDSNKLASDVGEVEDLNIISIGNACDNNVTARILNNPEPCDKYTKEGKGVIQIFESENEKVHIILSSDSEEGIKEAAETLANFDDYTFSGNSYEIDAEESDEGKKEKNDDEEQAIEQEQIEQEDNAQEAEQETVLIDYTGEEAEPVLKEEDDLVKKFFGFIKSIFTFWKK